MDRYGLRGNIVSHEKVDDIRYDYVEDVSEADKVFTVRTDRGIHYAKTVVLAVGGNPPQIPDNLSEGAEGATHAMHIKEFPSSHVREKLSTRSPVNIVIVGGGLTSAQLSDLAIRRGVNKVWLLMRGPLKVKYFDIGLEWVGKFRNFEQAAFWTSDSAEERWEKIMTARNGGSITPAYKKVLERHLSTGRLSLLQNTTIKDKSWDPCSKTWTVSLSDESQELPRIDHIYFATGVQGNFECLPFLKSMCSDYPIENCGGMPCITENMAVSLLHICLLFTPECPFGGSDSCYRCSLVSSYLCPLLYSSCITQLTRHTAVERRRPHVPSRQACCVAAGTRRPKPNRC